MGNARLDPWDLPRDVEYRLANKLLGKQNPLDREILVALVGRPKRYGELGPLLRGKGRNNLTMALDRLLGDGILRQTVDARRRPVVVSYELSPLGILVLQNMFRLAPVAETLEAYRRAVSRPESVHA